jgi:hypothetical protein
MFLVVDFVPGRLSCKFHGGYHGDVVVLVSCFRAGYYGGMIGHNTGRVLKSVVLISCYCILFWLLSQAGHR